MDFPLKTNLEMVRIFKELNGAFIASIVPFQFGRLPTNVIISFAENNFFLNLTTKLFIEFEKNTIAAMEIEYVSYF